MFFAWIPPGLRSFASASFASASSASSAHSLTPSLTHSPPHSLIFTHPLTHPLTPSLTHTLTHSLPGCLSRGRRSTQSLLEELRRAWAPLGRGWLLCGRRSTQSLLTELRRAWAPLGRWAAAGFTWHARLPFAWHAQYTELPEEAAARVGAAGPRLASRGRRSTESFLAAFRVAGAVHRASWRSCGARGRCWPAAGFTWQAQYRELPGCLSRGRRNTQSLLEELGRAWVPLGRGWLLCGRRSTQSLLKELRRWAAPLGRGCLHVAGAVQRASLLPFAWQAQYTEPPEGAAARVGAAGPRLASRGRRSTESFLAAFRVAGAVHRASWRSCGARGRCWPAAGFTWQAQYRELPGCLSRGRRNTQSLLEELRRAWAPLGRGWLLCGRRSTQSLLTELRRAWAPLGRWAAAGFTWHARLPFAWHAQYTELPEEAAARVGAAGPRLASRGRRSTESFLAAFRVAGAVHRASWRSCGARGRCWPAAGFTWQAQYRELPGCLSRGRRNTQSLLEELGRAWVPLGRGWLLCGRRSTQSLLKELRRWAAPLGRGCLHVAGAVQRASLLPFAWQAQYTEPPEGAAARVGAAGPRLASRGRRSTESFLAAFRVAGAVHRASWRSCGARGRRWAAAGFCVAGAVHRAS